MQTRRILEWSAWVLGAALLLFYGGVRVWSENARVAGIEEFRRMTVAEPAAGGPQDAVPAPSHPVDQSLWSKQRVAAYARAAAMGEVAQALLRIPALDLEVPVFEGTGEENLDRGAGHIEGTTALGEPGNAGVAGHRDGFFRKLKDARLDQIIYLDLPGRTLRYRVAELSLVVPTESQVLAPADAPSLTLVTCYPFYFVGSAPQRFIVRAELDDTPEESTVPRR
ncbi:MAG TPA: class D sortase [Steroidobacteraceae bacterium]|nr:class D sortase [Steroidobacteraceae bacterium]